MVVAGADAVAVVMAVVEVVVVVMTAVRAATATAAAAAVVEAFCLGAVVRSALWRGHTTPHGALHIDIRFAWVVLWAVHLPDASRLLSMPMPQALCETVVPTSLAELVMQRIRMVAVPAVQRLVGGGWLVGWVGWLVGWFPSAPLISFLSHNNMSTRLNCQLPQRLVVGPTTSLTPRVCCAGVTPKERWCSQPTDVLVVCHARPEYEVEQEPPRRAPAPTRGPRGSLSTGTVLAAAHERH